MSLCVHDSPEFLQVQLENINKYIDNCVIVMHVNSDTMELDENMLPENVWINPVRFRVLREREEHLLLRGFVSNIVHAYKICRFDRVLFLSSSCMFFRRLSWADIPKTAVCITPIDPPGTKRPETVDEAIETNVWWYPRASRDAHLVTWLRNKNFNNILGGQISGTLLPEVCIPWLLELANLEGIQTYDYPYVEVYPQTVGLYYSKINNLTIYPALIQLLWWNGDEAYLCRSDVVYDMARTNNDIYGVMKVEHDINGPAMSKLRQLQDHFKS